MSDFLPQEFIAEVRDTGHADPQAIRQFINGIATGETTNAQIGAFTMAVFFKDLDIASRVALTEAMRDSGDVLDWADLDGPVVDKHSTGGIGDNVSLLLGPAVAACGAYVPMISGRGLGHTGGTLDKFDAIPGYQTVPDNDLFRQVVKETGCAIIGQTGSLAPADATIYGIRSVTATVENTSLITASILSKKLAAGLDGLVLDIKCGNGAFMDNLAAARTLARSLVTVANGAGVKTLGLITDMNEPLAPAAGNALEVAVAVDHLAGRYRNPRLHEVVVTLSANMLVTVGLAADLNEARGKVEATFDSGRAAEVFEKMVAGLGGPGDFLQRSEHYLAKAPVIVDVTAPEGGIISAIKTREIGLAVIRLGGGRKRAEDTIDYSVGYDQLAGIGDSIAPGAPIGRVHARSESDAEMAKQALLDCYTFNGPAADNPLIVETVAPSP